MDRDSFDPPSTPENNVNVPSINAFRRAVGLPETPDQFLSNKRAERVRSVHDVNRNLLHEVHFTATEGMVHDRIKNQELRRSGGAWARKHLTPLERGARAIAIISMKMHGVNRPGELISILEQLGSDLIFDYESQSYALFPANSLYGLPQLQKLNYDRPRRVYDSRFLLTQIDRNDLKTGLERMRLLGFRVDYSQEGMHGDLNSDFMQYFMRLAKLPEETFNRNIELLNSKGVYLNERKFSKYWSENGKDAHLRQTWGTDLLLTTLETGEIPTALEVRLKTASKIGEISDGLVAIPFDALGDFSPADLEALAIIIEHEVAGFGNTDAAQRYYYHLNNAIILGDLTKLNRQKALPIFAQALDQGLSLVDVLHDSYENYYPGNWTRGFFASGLHEPDIAVADRANDLQQFISSDNFPFIQALIEFYQQENWSYGSRSLETTMIEMIQKKALVIIKTFQVLQALSKEDKKVALTSFYDSNNPPFWATDTLMGEIRSAFMSHLGNLDDYKQMVAAMLCSENGNFDMELIKTIPDKSKIPERILIKYIESESVLNSQYKTLKAESENSSWADAIPDPALFWKENLHVLVTLCEKGLSPSNLLIFRRLAGNNDVREMLQDSSLSANFFNTLAELIGLSENNITYTNSYVLKIALDESVSNRHRTQFYRTLHNNHPREFTSTVMCIRQARGIDLDRLDVQQTILRSINEVGAMTPTVMKDYVNEADPVKRIQFLELVKTAKKLLLSSEPVRHLFADRENGEELLAELITIAFPGNQLDQVKSELIRLSDRPEDLHDFKINPNGYEYNLAAKIKTSYLKEGEKLDPELIDYLRRLIPSAKKVNVSNSDFNDAVIKLLRGAGTYQLNDLQGELPIIFSVLSRDEEMRDVRKAVVDQSQASTVTQFLGRISEVIGVYFKDNFAARLDEAITHDADLAERIADNATPKRLYQIEKNLAKLSDQDQAILKPALKKIHESISQNQPLLSKDIAVVLSVILGNRILGSAGGLRAKVKKELRKFEFKEAVGTGIEDTNQPFKGVVSKNVASFFAKRTAGLCTAADTSLFNRPDHLHINLIRGDEVIGNIQGYIIEFEGKKTLLFRGLNPSASVVNHGNAEFYCEGMINIIKQFAQENSLEEVFLCEQLGGWHALTNRVGEGVVDYLSLKYLSKENEVEFSFPITAGQSISKMYRLKIL